MKREENLDIVSDGEQQFLTVTVHTTAVPIEEIKHAWMEEDGYRFSS